jgi:hypothetical protein
MVNRKILMGANKVVNESICSESSLNKSDLVQIRFIKIQIESSRTCETLRVEETSSSSTRYYLS